MSLQIENVLSAIKKVSSASESEYDALCSQFEKDQAELVEAVDTLSETGIDDDFYGFAFGLVMIINEAYQVQLKKKCPVISAEMVNEMVKFQLQDFSKHAADLDGWRDALGSDPERFVYYYIIEMLIEQGWRVEMPGGINVLVMLMAVADAYDETVFA